MLLYQTSLLVTYTTNTFPQEHTPTIFNSHTVNVVVDDNKFKLNLWDVAGDGAPSSSSERLRPLSYAETDVFLFCFSIDSPSSLESLQKKWHSEVTELYPNAPFIIVGLKKDLRNSQERKSISTKRNKNVVSYTKGATMAAKLGAAMYLECSALNKGEGLKELFDAAVKVANDAIQAKRKKNKDYTSGSAGMCCTII